MLFALADLHLNFGVPEKTMEVFGSAWKNYTTRIRDQWISTVTPEDLVLVAGDISWAMRPEVAKIDLEWIDALPGTKVFIRGNHDYWWGSLSQVKKILPASCHVIQNNAFHWKGISIAGSRLWDTPEVKFANTAETEPSSLKTSEEIAEDARIFERELGRLEMSLKCLDPKASLRIAMTHYPPIGPALVSTRASELLEKYRVEYCLFGHLHGFAPGSLPFGTQGGVRYVLTSCDYLEFAPLKIL